MVHQRTLIPQTVKKIVLTLPEKNNDEDQSEQIKNSTAKDPDVNAKNDSDNELERDAVDGLLLLSGGEDTMDELECTHDKTDNIDFCEEIDMETLMTALHIAPPTKNKTSTTTAPRTTPPANDSTVDSTSSPTNKPPERDLTAAKLVVNNNNSRWNSVPNSTVDTVVPINQHPKCDLNAAKSAVNNNNSMQNVPTSPIRIQSISLK